MPSPANCEYSRSQHISEAVCVSAIKSCLDKMHEQGTAAQVAVVAPSTLPLPGSIFSVIFISQRILFLQTV